MNEVRLIDANALKEDLRRYFTDGVLDGVSAKVTFNQILLDIDNAPTVELTELCKGCQYLKDCETCDKNERPQGAWRVYEGVITCEKCGKETEEMTPFCSWCGADMRGGAK